MTTSLDAGPNNRLAAGPLGRGIAWLIGPRGLKDPDRLRREVQGKIAVVTGASYGLGEATSRMLAAAGATVVLGARSVEQLELIVAEIEAEGGRAVAVPLDLASEESIEAFAAQILSRFGQIDYLVHNAGKSLRRSIHLSYDRPKDLNSTTSANYIGPMRLTLALLPAMRERGSGHIVNVSTVAVMFPVAPKWGFYLSSKAAFDIWMRAVGMEARPDGVTLTTLYAGSMFTRMSAPSGWISALPGQSAREAGYVIAKAIVRKPRVLAPAYGRPSAVLVSLLRTTLEVLTTQLYRYLGDTQASLARIEKGNRNVA
ncbi:SDR family NAD(P)-dependent oxidoreductase [Nocardia yamanashiensis]|uniref:SDR family NAD(P)-dependent oxidoreductase n=1 Tax=Nocardia yamanashiensis TaxID=209247 RepID=UPI001E2EE7C4|nr:SDR family NAD(P)-dependent oxidoreductase [Nocardia yamanashiensis]UGT42330.1 SDR family NAD(P)-dependent oxidoreductase [Nocardia yamanashiensis]